MSWLMAAIYERTCTPSEEAGLSDWRAQLLSNLEGSVLEVGTGTGLNLLHYSKAVTRLVLSEPDKHMQRALERKRGADLDERMEVMTASVDDLPMEDASFDAVVSTLVLCSAADPAQGLAEIFRVLRPGGQFAFLEHVAADPRDEASRHKWQGRIEPIWKRVMDNCHLRRETERYIKESGFDIEWIERELIPKAPSWVRPSIRGIARKPT
ncbi:MAG: class I SAM-dependent methyltransferase [Sinobacteraceae bacterium]|nr:class I SAM-dependent methyltransferase [Nevskiaceae bacterium]